MLLVTIKLWERVRKQRIDSHFFKPGYVSHNKGKKCPSTQKTKPLEVCYIRTTIDRFEKAMQSFYNAYITVGDSKPMCKLLRPKSRSKLEVNKYVEKFVMPG